MHIRAINGQIEGVNTTTMNKPTWKNTLTGMHASWKMDHNDLQNFASTMGYPYFEYNGYVYATDIPFCAEHWVIRIVHPDFYGY